MSRPCRPLNESIDPQWALALAPVEEQIHHMGDFLHEQAAEGKQILPAAHNILRAFREPSFDAVKVLIVGQDPYPTPGYPVGLSFSVAPDVRPLPKSLINIYKELQDDLHVPQWLPYDYADAAGKPLTTLEALQEVADYLDRNGLPVLHASTQLLIAPGYAYHVVRTMVTNFHQPKSTLLLLVSAFVGGDWRRIYDYALGHGFRFLSYGDSSLLNY